MKRVLEIISEVFETDQKNLSSNLMIRHLLKWDSFNHISMIIAIENEYQISFTPKEIESIHSLEELLNLINSKKNK